VGVSAGARRAHGNLVGDTANAILRDDPRTLIGLPIGGLLIAYLLRPKIKDLFGNASDA